MKTKIILIVFILSLILLIFLRDSSSIINAVCYDASGSVCVYAYSDFDQKDVVKCGEMNIVRASNQFINSLKSDEYLGQVIEFEKLNIDEFIKKNNIEMISKEVVGNINVFNCYAVGLPKFVVVDGERINLQIAQTQSSVKVGYPLIIGSF